MARTAPRGDVRQAIASLLRLAHTDAQDARTLAEAGGTRNVASLLHSAISRLIEAVAASEQGNIGPPDVRRIDRRNPLKSTLLQLDTFFETPFTLQQDGRLTEPSSAASLMAPLDTLAEALERVVQHCGVDLDGSGPVENADPLRPVVEATLLPPPAPAPKPRRAEPARHPASVGRTSPGKSRSGAAAASSKPIASAPSQPKAATAKAPEPPAHPRHAGLTSNSFWTLVERWQLPDLDALQLISHAGRLTQKGTRPRFKLSDSEAEVVSAMASLDATLAQLSLDPATWLSKPLRSELFQGAAPLDLIRKTRLQGLRDVSRYLTQMGFRLSLQGD